MTQDRKAPMTAAERWETDDPCVEEDARPWGHVTASANTFWTVDDDAVELVESELRRGAIRLRARGPLLEGLPVERVGSLLCRYISDSECCRRDGGTGLLVL